MNIFAVSRHPRKCARALDDKRLNKMILETAQILCTVINEAHGDQLTPYRSCHVNHPITLWAKDDIWRHRWLYRLGVAYQDEIWHRRKTQHSSYRVLAELDTRFPYLSMFEADPRRIDFHNGARHKGLGLDFTHLPVHEAYRSYLNARWPGDKRKPVWTNRRPPTWSIYSAG